MEREGRRTGMELRAVFLQQRLRKHEPRSLKCATSVVLRKASKLWLTRRLFSTLTDFRLNLPLPYSTNLLIELDYSKKWIIRMPGSHDAHLQINKI